MRAFGSLAAAGRRGDAADRLYIVPLLMTPVTAIAPARTPAPVPGKEEMP